MSRKLSFIPHISDYKYIREQMMNDLEYRLKSRNEKTSLGRPLYERINVQLIMTQECPYNCPFCMERKNPMTGVFEPEEQIYALKFVLNEHPNARLTITGGEPSLYPGHVRNLVSVFKNNSNDVFASINTAGYNPEINGIAHINLSVNEYVKPDLKMFPKCTYQTVLSEKDMTIDNIKKIMADNPEAGSFSFRFLSSTENHEYDVSIWNLLQEDNEIKVSTFRIGDFFVYCTFDWNGKHARITLGDMYQQQHNDYQDGYSNIIIHPNGTINVNWK